MPVNIEQFASAYKKWATDNLADYEAGRVQEIMKKYPFVVPTDVPWTPYRGDPATQTVALVTSGGLYLKDSQLPFDTVSIHGDASLREIPRTVRQEDLAIAHAHYDHALAEQDINVIFPIQRLLELEAEGLIGKVAPTHYSFSYVNDVVPLVTATVPQMLDRMKAEGVDFLILVPV